MTIDETKDELYRLLSDCVNNCYPIRNNTQKGRYRNAVNMAIASLEAWEKVKTEIEDYKEKYIKLHHDWDSTMIQGYDDALMVIAKHLQEATE